MFQGILEKLLKKYLGEYVDGLEKQNLSVSVSNGEIDLKDLKLKKNICDKLDLPVSLILGRMKRLYIKVPWHSLASQPVKLEIFGLELLLKPLDKGSWEQLFKRQNTFKVLEKELLDHSLKVLKEMIEENSPKDDVDKLGKTSGFLVNLTTKIVDNLQIVIKNIHIRFEDTQYMKDPLSMGITLQKLAAHTTDEKWQSNFIDRTQEKNKLKPLQKLLDLSKIGFYCKPRDRKENMITLLGETQLNVQYKKFGALFPVDAAISEAYDSSYILRPISIMAKFQQLSSQLKIFKEPEYQISMNIDEFEIAFAKSQLLAVINFFENVNEFQMKQDNFLNQRKEFLLNLCQNDVKQIEQKRNDFKKSLAKLVYREVNIMAWEGKKLPTDQLSKFKREAKLEPTAAKTFQNVVEYDNINVLKEYAREIVSNDFKSLQEIVLKQQPPKGKQDQGMVFKINTLFSQALKDKVKPGDQITSGSSSVQLDQIPRSSVNTENQDSQSTTPDEDLEEIVKASTQIYDTFSVQDSEEQNTRPSARGSMPIFQARFHMKSFKLCLVNDSAVKYHQAPSQKSDTSSLQRQVTHVEGILSQHERQEIMLYVIDLKLQYDKYDDEDIQNKNSDQLVATLGDLGLVYVQELESDQERDTVIQQSSLLDSNKFIRSEHKVLWNRAQGKVKKDLIDLKLDVANNKLKQQRQSLAQFSSAGQVNLDDQLIDILLNVEVQGIVLEYRKEYIEFFMGFFESGEEIQDELKLRAQDEYERLREKVSFQNMRETTEELGSTFRVAVHLQDSCAFFPIYNSIVDESLNNLNENRHELQLPDTTNKSAWIAHTGEVYFDNGDRPLFFEYQNKPGGQSPRCPEGMTPLNLQLNPGIFYTHDLAKWWKDDFSETTPVLESVIVESVLSIKNKSYKYKKDTLDVHEFGMDFQVGKAKFYLNPMIYNRLINIVECFDRPLAKSGDVEKGKMAERLHIFQKANMIAEVRKRGTTVKYWHDYIAVFSGSYIYFYPAEDAKLIQDLSLHFNVGNSNIAEAPRSSVKEESKKTEKAAPKQLSKQSAKDFQKLNYEESFIVKGCHDVQPFKMGAETPGETSKGEVKKIPPKKPADKAPLKRSATDPGIQTAIIMTNSKNQECILEFRLSKDKNSWTDKVKKRALEIDQFLKRDKFKVGKFGSVKGKQLTNNKLQEIMVREQLDEQGYDHLVKDDPLQLQQIYVASISQLIVVVEGFSKIKLDSRTVDPSERDEIILSPKVPEQLNTKQPPKVAEEEERFQFLLFAEQFSFAFEYREFDQDIIIGLRTLTVIDRTRALQELHKKQKDKIPKIVKDYDPSIDDLYRYQVILRSEAPSHQESLIRCVLSFQGFKSPKYHNVEIGVDLSIQRLNLNWHPIALNRLIRLLRFMKHPKEIYDQERLNIMQTYKLRLQQLQKDLNRQRQDREASKGQTNHAEQVKRCKKTREMMRKLNKAIDIHKQMGNLSKEQSSVASKGAVQPALGVRDKSQTIKVGAEQRRLITLDKTHSRITCHDDPTVVVQVTVKVDKIKLVTIHPQNDSYPIFTAKLMSLSLKFQMLQDHDAYEASLGDFKVLDNTEHPRTLDPRKNYTKDDPMRYYLVLGFAERKDLERNTIIEEEDEDEGGVKALTFKMKSFHFPKDHSCPEQKNLKQFDSIIDLDIKSLKLNYIQEQFLRLTDYFLCQLVSSLADTNPFQDLIMRLEKQIDPFSQENEDKNQSAVMGSSVDMKNLKNDPKGDDSDGEVPEEEDMSETNASMVQVPMSRLDLEAEDENAIDLRQETQVPRIQIRIENPRLILKDRPYLVGNIVIDLGNILITNRNEEVTGRWKSQPNRLVYANTMDIDISKIRIDYGIPSQQLTPQFDLKIEYQRINPSPLIQEGQLIQEQDGEIDFKDLQTQEMITIKCPKNVDMNVRQTFITYLMRCIDLNINNTDGYEPYFEFQEWNSIYTMKLYDIRQVIKKKFLETSIKRREIRMSFPTLSLKLLNESRLGGLVPMNVQVSRDLLAELILCGLDISVDQFLDDKTTIEMKAKTCYVLHKDKEVTTGVQEALQDLDLKSLLIGPFSSPRSVRTTEEFYAQKKSDKIPVTPSQGQFILEGVMLPSGEQKIDATLQQLKLFLRIDILFLLQRFVMDALPTYDQREEKPSHFQKDPGEVPRRQYNLMLRESLVCFEQMQLTSDYTQQFEEFQKNKNSNKHQDKEQDKQTNAQAESQAGQAKRMNNYFTKTVAFQGQVNLSYITEKLNKIKEDVITSLINSPVQKVQAARKSSNQSIKSKNVSQVQVEEGEDGQIPSSYINPIYEEAQEEDPEQLKPKAQKYELPIKQNLLVVTGLQPFFCDIRDLNEGISGISEQVALSQASLKSSPASLLALKRMSKRQLISPFNFELANEQLVQLSQSTDLHKKLRSFKNKKDGDKQRKLHARDDHNFQFYEQSKFEFQLAEVHVSFNDLIILKGIYRKWMQLSDDFERKFKVQEQFRKTALQKKALEQDPSAENKLKSQIILPAIDQKQQIDSKKRAQSTRNLNSVLNQIAKDDKKNQENTSSIGQNQDKDVVIVEQDEYLENNSDSFSSSSDEYDSDSLNSVGSEEQGFVIRNNMQKGNQKLPTGKQYSSEVANVRGSSGVNCGQRQGEGAVSKVSQINSLGQSNSDSLQDDSDGCDFEDDDDMDDDRQVDSVNMVKPSGLKNKLKAAGSEVKLDAKAKAEFKSKIMTSLTDAAKSIEKKKKEMVIPQKRVVQIVEKPAPIFKPFKSKIKKQKRAQKSQKVVKQTVIILDMSVQTDFIRQARYLADYRTRPVTQRAIDEVIIVTKGLKMIFINDRDSNFLPIISINCSPFFVQWDFNSLKTAVATQIKFSANFFNVNIGRWEPFAEKFTVQMITNKDVKTLEQSLKVLFNSPLNINITEKLIENLYESNRSWNICQEDFKLFENLAVDQHKRDTQIGQDEDGVLDNDLLNFTSSMMEGKNEDNVLQPRLSVVDAKFRRTLSQAAKQSSEEEQSPSLLKKQSSDGSTAIDQVNDEMITPYVIVNKTDLAVIVKRLQKKEDSDKQKKLDLMAAQREHDLLELGGLNIEGQIYTDQLEAIHSASAIRKKALKPMYRVPQGQIVDFVVDYNDENYKPLDAPQFEQPVDQTPRDSDIHAVGVHEQNTDDKVHQDHIGEYKSEYIKIQFDKTSAWVQHNRSNYDENRDIKKIDLNELGYRTHILREGQFTERIFYGCKLIDSKKVFTVRSQFQLVNFTGYDYLVYFKFSSASMMKYLESGDSLPLSMRLDECKIQIKMIDEEILAALSKDKKQSKGDANLQRPLFDEEIRVNNKKEHFMDMRDPKLGYKNWSALIPVKIFKDKLGMEESSYLSNGVSKFTFIKKTKSNILSIERAIDINLMPAMIIKNCLPFDLTLKFKDSSEIQQSLKFQKEEEKNLFCFSMAHTVEVDLILPEFEVVRGLKIFNLENYKSMEEIIPLEDRYGRKTSIYAQIQRKNAGQRVIFYCKKILVDSIDSELKFFYKKPTLMGNKERELVDNMIPWVDQGVLRQKFYIIPEEISQQHLYAALIKSASDFNRKDCVKIDIQTTSAQQEFTLKDKSTKHHYCYSTEIYLSTYYEYIYTKITTVSPYYVIVNESSQTIILEQSENPATEAEKNEDYLPLLLEPGQRQAFFFYSIPTKVTGVDEFLHLRLLDYQVTAKELEDICPAPEGQPKLPESLSFRKQFNWTCPFQISSVSDFTLQVRPDQIDSDDAENLSKLKNAEQKDALFKILNGSSYVKVSCKTDLGENMGSMFVVITDELEEKCEYKVVNETKLVDLIYQQHFTTGSMTFRMTTQQANINKLNTKEQQKEVARLKGGQSQRFSWPSVLHDKLLRVQFILPHEMMGAKALEMKGLTDKQKQRSIRDTMRRGPIFELLIPLDKIGHSDQFELHQVLDAKTLKQIGGPQPSEIGKIKISVTTNGYTKILKVQEPEPEYWVDLDSRASQVSQQSMVIKNDDLHVQEGPKMKTKIGELRMQSICMSLIHRKRELMTIFTSGVLAEIEDNDDASKLKFSIGYIQIDNQSEAEPAMAVVIRPRDLYYESGKIEVRLERETAKEREEREKAGLANLEEDSARIFQLEVNGNKNALGASSDVIYIESIMFLVQTLQIKIQFTHFLKIASFIYHLSRVLNHSVTQVHYIFETDDKYLKQGVDEVAFKYSPAGQVAEQNKQKLIDFGDSIQAKKQERLRAFVKQDVMVGSKVQNQKKQKNDALMMSNTDNNWQFSSKMVNSKTQRRIFIKTYQASPLELVVSAINERLKKEKKVEETKAVAPDTKTNQINSKTKTNDPKDKTQNDEKDEVENQRLLMQNGLIEFDENNDVHTSGDSEVVGFLGARDEQFARRFLYFSTFEDMLFRLNGLNISNIFGDGYEVFSQLGAYHRETFKYNALRIFGSSNLIGNPSKLVSGVGTGVNDFFVKPYQGMKGGTIVKAAGGFAEGGKSFMKNAMMAPVGAVSKIGSSISKGTVALSLDDQFIEAKNNSDALHQPKNVGEGLVKGFSSAGSSIWSGVSGVFTKPVEGAKQGGAKGFAKGLGRGAAGLVTKTVAGTIDIVAKTSEGLDNQTKSQANILAASRRMRLPRPFYENNNLIRPYDSFQANWAHVIPITCQQVGLQQLYELFAIERETVPVTVNKKELLERTWSVFAVTKYLIVEAEYKTIHHKDEQGNEDQLAALMQSPPAYPKVASDGTGQKLSIESVYLLRYLDFINMLDDGHGKQVLALGFRLDQAENLKKETMQSSKQIVTKLMVTDKGEHMRYIQSKQAVLNMQAGKQDQIKSSGGDGTLIQKKTAEEMARVNEGIMNEFVEEVALREKQNGYTMPSVKRGQYFLRLTPTDAVMAQQIHDTLHRIKAVIKKENQREKPLAATD